MALLTSITPVAKCSLYTEEYGTLTLSAMSSSSSSNSSISRPIRPDVRTLSVVCYKSLMLSTLDNSVGDDNDTVVGRPKRKSVRGREEIEIRLLEHGHKGNETYDDDSDDRIQNLLQTINEIKGLEERLSDAAPIGHHHGTSSPLEDFVMKSEAIFTEFLSAIRQYQEKQRRLLRQKKGRKEAVQHHLISGTKRSRHQDVITHGSHVARQPNYLLPLQYYYALISQLETLEHMMYGKSHNNNQSIVTNLNDELTQLTLSYVDERKRQHELHVQLTDNFPSGRPIFVVDLPAEFEPKWKVPPLVDECENGTAAPAAAAAADTTNTTTGKARQREGETSEYFNSCNFDATSSYGLVHVYQSFQNLILTFQSLWDELDDIDQNVWVLEPPLPARRAITERRIAIQAGGISLILTLDPYNSRSIPLSVRFVGAGIDVANMRTQYKQYTSCMDSCGTSSSALSLEERKDDNVNDAPVKKQDVQTTSNKHEKKDGATSKEPGNRNAEQLHNTSSSQQEENDQENVSLKRWSEDISVRANLERCLGFSLPSPMNTNKSDYITECGICYSHRLPMEEKEDEEGGGTDNDTMITTMTSQLPDATCSNPSCARSYHETCLFEWLHSLPSARISFDRIFGTCPYCCEPISVRTSRGV